MNINDLSVGDKVLFGQCQYENDPSCMIDLVWLKADPNNTFVSDQCVARLVMDEPEPDNSSRDRRERGSNFFPQSNLLQWLNARGLEWFQKAHDTDVAPSYGGWRGFLSDFATWELDTIEPHDVCTVVPDGFRREFGLLHHMNSMVSILSLSEVCNDAVDPQTQEGSCLEYYATGNPRPRCWLRTACASTMQCFDSYGSPISRAASQRYYVVPKIRIKGTVNISDEPDADGYYRVLSPDGNESCINVSELYQVLAH